VTTGETETQQDFTGTQHINYERNAQETACLIELGFKKTTLSSQEIMESILIPASKRIAEEFRGADFYIPDVLFAAAPY